MASDSGHLAYRGELKGHNGWVTAIATSPEVPDMVLTTSRDKSLIKWKITREEDRFGIPEKRLTGHSHYVQDVSISSDGQYCLSGSWDATMRLWNLNTGKTTSRFVGHNKDVLSVAFSPDNRQIISGSRDRTIRLWNVLGDQKYSFNKKIRAKDNKLVDDDKSHDEWVSCVRFSPNKDLSLVVSAGWDKVVRLWNMEDMSHRSNLLGHTGYINTVTVSPDGSLCASGGKDGAAMLWDLNESRHLSTLEAHSIIHALAFSPSHYWLCAATATSIKIWDLESRQVVAELTPELPARGKKATPVQCISLAWSADGETLYAGYTDNVVRVWSVLK